MDFVQGEDYLPFAVETKLELPSSETVYEFRLQYLLAARPRESYLTSQNPQRLHYQNGIKEH